MTVRIGDVSFSDWVSLPFQDGWTDTFIFRISASACIPPFDYDEPLRRIVSHTLRKRHSASIWVQVDAPGDWFIAEVRRSLKGLKLPFAVSRVNKSLDWLDFSRPPWLGYAQSKHPPKMDVSPQSLSQDAILCLQALARTEKADADEIASLAGLSLDVTHSLLADLEKRKKAVCKISPRIQQDKSKPKQMDQFHHWHLTRPGLSLALRSWNIPPGISFESRSEENQQYIETDHRHLSRMWPAWLKSAWPQAEIWTGWSEVRVPEISVIPDGLAWGRIQGYETLFWLEVGDEHKNTDDIAENTSKRLDQAVELCKRTGVRLVYAQLSPHWVREAARWMFVNLPEYVAVVLGDWKKFGQLPLFEWGRVVGK